MGDVLLGRPTSAATLGAVRGRIRPFVVIVALMVAGLPLALGGCYSSRGFIPADSGPGVSPPTDITEDGGSDDPPRTSPPSTPPPPTRPLPPSTQLDLLFLIDNSNSMTEEQESLSEQLPRLIQVLASGDADGDGVQDFPTVESLHVGVVTTDMGTGGFPVPTCNEPNRGDDGELRSIGNSGLPVCPRSFPAPFLSYRPAGPLSPAEFAANVSCISVVGTGGCGFEQPLEAVLKALTFSTTGPTGAFDGDFLWGTTGHADGANGGFSRPTADLAIVMLTDEEDCSVLDPELFNVRSPVYREDLNLRCFAHPETLHPVSRYVDGLLAGRDPRRVHFQLIAGVPTDAVGGTYAEILAHPAMHQVVDPVMEGRLQPSCNVPGRGLAFAPTRLVEVARGLDREGAAVSIQSICQADLTPAIDAFIAMIR